MQVKGRHAQRLYRVFLSQRHKTRQGGRIGPNIMEGHAQCRSLMLQIIEEELGGATARTALTHEHLDVGPGLDEVSWLP
jgi:hypothetical protein